MEKYVRTYESFKIKESINKFLTNFKEEVARKKELRRIFIKYFKHIPLTEEDNNFVKDQTLDMLKMLGMTSLFVLPGSTLLIPFIVKLCTKYNVNIIPYSFKLESATTDEIVNLIEDGKKIYVKYIQDLPEHDEEESVTPVDIDKEGNITLDIDSNLYYTKVEWVDGIDENDNFLFEIDPDNTSPESTEAQQEKANAWKQDLEFIELLKDQGGIKNIIAKMKKVYDLDYAHCKNEEELCSALRTDKML